MSAFAKADFKMCFKLLRNLNLLMHKSFTLRFILKHSKANEKATVSKACFIASDFCSHNITCNQSLFNHKVNFVNLPKGIETQCTEAHISRFKRIWAL